MEAEQLELIRETVSGRIVETYPAFSQRVFAFPSNTEETEMIRIAVTAVLLLLISFQVHAFCGFYVARADTQLFNQASQVVLVRDDDRTVLTMANDFQGESSEFAIVIPVPTVPQREQINVNEKALIDHLDAFTGPARCEAARDYFECELPRRQQREAEQLASLTGWDINDIRQRMPTVDVEVKRDPWWKRIWRNN